MTPAPKIYSMNFGWVSDAVAVDRSSPWGNPFARGRNNACDMFEEYASKRALREPDWLAPLKGKHLMCHCRDARYPKRSPLRCHSETLLRLANPDVPVFVFGSNLAGRHGAGAAKSALSYRSARYGQGRGLQGLSYAIPTKDHNLDPLPLSAVEDGVGEFLDFAISRQDLLFQVTPIGTGLAGFLVEEIKPLFDLTPVNCIMPGDWESYPPPLC